MNVSENLDRHLQTKEEDRHFQWDETFFKLFSESEVQLLSQDPQQGPDNWPYLMCQTISNATDTKQQNLQPTESVQKIIHWLSTKGIGLVVNPQRMPYPDFVFSYGMIWSFRETGYFIKPNQQKTIKEELVFDDQQFIKSGPPSEKYLPNYVRQILRDFFRDQSVFAVKILVISKDGSNYDLCFSLESLGSPPATEHQGILEAISWFLPPHYSLALISENNLPDFSLL